MGKSRLIGIFGGTFDPVHHGHINSVTSLLEEIELERIYMLPSAVPPHRSPARTTPEQRLVMVRLAIEPYPKLLADGRECTRPGKSYTIDTLASFRREFASASLVFIAGMDAYLSMPQWRRWQDFLDMVHICVLRRPGYKTDTSWGDRHIVADKTQLQTKPSGSIYCADTVLVDISSTRIRRKLRAREPVGDELPAGVLNYIIENKLYVNTRTA